MQELSSPAKAFRLAAETGVRQLEPGIRRQILGSGRDLMLCRVWFDEGAEGAVHSHPHSQSSYVESGRFRVTIEDEERELGPGDAFYVAPNRAHGAVCVSAGALLDAFSPSRADFLEEKG